MNIPCTGREMGWTLEEQCDEHHCVFMASLLVCNESD